jgi:hypothetical protein
LVELEHDAADAIHECPMFRIVLAHGARVTPKGACGTQVKPHS